MSDDILCASTQEISLLRLLSCQVRSTRVTVLLLLALPSLLSDCLRENRTETRHLSRSRISGAPDDVRRRWTSTPTSASTIHGRARHRRSAASTAISRNAPWWWPNAAPTDGNESSATRYTRSSNHHLLFAMTFLGLPPLPDYLPTKQKYVVGEPVKKVTWNKINPQTIKKESLWASIDEKRCQNKDFFASIKENFATKAAPSKTILLVKRKYEPVICSFQRNKQPLIATRNLLPPRRARRRQKNSVYLMQELVKTSVRWTNKIFLSLALHHHCSRLLRLLQRSCLVNWNVHLSNFVNGFSLVTVFIWLAICSLS